MAVDVAKKDIVYELFDGRGAASRALARDGE